MFSDNKQITDVMKKIIFILFLFISGKLFSQELNCQVKIENTSKSQTVDQKVYQTLQRSLTEFMNNRRWTDDVFEPYERIECSIFINIIEESGSDYYKAQATVQANRPVFKSTYNTVLLNSIDKEFEFEYHQDQQIEFIENTNSSNLTSLMAFYAYLIIGLDYDSFSPLGGTPYFLKAQSIVNSAQNTPEPGWKSKKFTDIKNRYWIAENFLSPKYEKIRNASYKYHRYGLDKMYEKPDDAKKVISESLNDISNLAKENNNSMIVLLFFNSKSDELINIYSQGTTQEKNNAIQILSSADPSNSQKYRRISK